ncbi:hypothetical protein GEMRC1_003908 [Eukaryota sp. GEM-RC1]
MDIRLLPPGRRFFISLGLSQVNGSSCNSRVFLSVQNEFSTDYELTLSKKYPKICKLQLDLQHLVGCCQTVLQENPLVIAVVSLKFNSGRGINSVSHTINPNFQPEDHFQPVAKVEDGDSIIEQILKNSSSEMSVSDQISKIFRISDSSDLSESFNFSIPQDLLSLPASILHVSLYTCSNPSFFDFSIYRNFSLALESILPNPSSLKPTILSTRLSSLEDSNFSLKVKARCWTTAQWIHQLSSCYSIELDGSQDTSAEEDMDDDDDDSVQAEKGSIIKGPSDLIDHFHDDDDDDDHMGHGHPIDCDNMCHSEEAIDKLVEEVDRLEQQRDYNEPSPSESVNRRKEKLDRSEKGERKEKKDTENDTGVVEKNTYSRLLLLL